MTLPIELLHLLKREFQEIYNPNSAGKYKSATKALELIEQFKTDIQNETLQNLQNETNNHSTVPNSNIPAPILRNPKPTRR